MTEQQNEPSIDEERKIRTFAFKKLMQLARETTDESIQFRAAELLLAHTVESND